MPFFFIGGNSSDDPAPVGVAAPNEASSKSIVVKKWILYIVCTASAIAMALSFVAIAIYMILEPSIRTAKAYELELWHLCGISCQVIGFFGAWTLRLHFVLGHVFLAALMVIRITFAFYRDKSLSVNEAISAETLFFMSMIASLVLAWELYKKDEVPTPPNGDEDDELDDFEDA